MSYAYHDESIEELRDMIRAYVAEIRDPDTHSDDVADKTHEVDLMRRALRRKLAEKNA
mgnify:CR=1 FL=1